MAAKTKEDEKSRGIFKASQRLGEQQGGPLARRWIWPGGIMHGNAMPRGSKTHGGDRVPPGTCVLQKKIRHGAIEGDDTGEIGGGSFTLL